MTDFVAALDTRVSLLVRVTELSADVASNTSQVNLQLWLLRVSGARFSNYTDNSWGMSVNGQGASGTGTYDVSSSDQLKLNQTFTIAHNDDGTGSVSVAGRFKDPRGNVGNGTDQYVTGTMALSTIPRASTPSYTNPMTAGTSYTITTNRANAGFTHTMTWQFGSDSGTIGTGIGASTTWTPPMSMLNQIPNAVTGVGQITTTTYNGTTVIGTKVTTLNINAPASVVPDFTTVTNTEATTSPNIASLVGAYVQGFTKLNAAITGAVGSYGSTVTGYKITVADQVINAASGTTGVINQTGALSLVGTVTDSRGRTASKTVTINVLPYAPPSIPTSSAVRSNVSGTPIPAGTYIKVGITAAVQSLLVGTQKNNLTYTVKTKLRGSTTPWASVSPVVGPTSAGALGYSNSLVIGTYSVANSYLVRVEISDNLGTVSAVEMVVSTGGVLVHYSRLVDGFGVGKYHENGSVDALGQMFQNNGKLVLDESYYATTAQAAAGTSTSTIISPATLKNGIANLSRTGTVSASWTSGLPTITLDTALADGTTTVQAYLPANDQDIQPGAKVRVDKLGAQWVITSSYADRPQYLRQIHVPVTSNWISYAEGVPSGSWGYVGTTLTGETGFYVTKDQYGVVMLNGLLRAKTTPAAGDIIATLPVGFRPSTGAHMFMSMNGVNAWSMLTIDDAGVMRVQTTSDVTGYLTLGGVVFRAAGEGTDVPGVSFANGWSNWGAGYAGLKMTTDPNGFNILEGLIKPGTNAVNSDVVTFPSAYQTRSRHRPAWGYGSNPVASFLRIGGPTSGIGSSVNIGSTAFSSYLSLAGHFWQSETTPLAWGRPLFRGAWTDYDTADSSFPFMRVARSTDGVVHVKGLIKSGTLGSVAAWLPREYRPRFTLMVPAVANATTARMDVGPDGSVIPSVGSNVWFSVETVFPSFQPLSNNAYN